MRIISKFHDYYDSAIGYGIDPKLMYKRDTKKVSFIIDDVFTHPRLETPETPNHDIDIFHIGFCGKIYPCVSFRRIGSTKKLCVYNSEQYKKLIRAIKGKVKKTDPRFRKLWGGKKIPEFLDEQTGKESMIDIFYKYKVPVFVIRSKQTNKWGTYNRKARTLILNPMLKEYEFYKVFDSYTAFQEINMFMSGVIGMNAPETVEISDKSKIEKKGFDEWSFRKEPEK